MNLQLFIVFFSFDKEILHCDLYKELGSKNRENSIHSIRMTLILAKSTFFLCGVRAMRLHFVVADTFVVYSLFYVEAFSVRKTSPMGRLSDSPVGSYIFCFPPRMNGGCVCWLYAGQNLPTRQDPFTEDAVYARVDVSVSSNGWKCSSSLTKSVLNGIRLRLCTVNGIGM